MSEIFVRDDSDTESVVLNDFLIEEDSNIINDDNEHADYQILPLPEVISQIKKMSEEIAEIVGLPPSAIRLLLPNFQFNKEKLINQFTSDGHIEVFLANTKVVFDLTDAIDFYRYEGECPICYFDDVTLISLKCGHHCCSECWNIYIRTEVHENGNVKIACFQHECGMKLMDEQVHRMILDEPLRQEYDRLLAQTFVDSSPSIKWCTGRGCDKLSTSRPLSVYCDCGADFCPVCNEKSHLPLSCAHLKIWKDGRILESASIEWISKNSRPCPKCKARIEKNGGCNFMECTSCHAPFCWHCMKVLARAHDGNHNCTRFDEETNAKSVEQLDLLRFEHYKQRFTTHTESEKLETALRPSMTSFCDKLEDKGFPKYKSGVCLQALQELLKSRRLLAYSCAFSYYLKHEPSRNIFEDNVELLEGYTERLSSLFVGTSPFWRSSENPLSFQPYLADLQDEMKHLKKCRQILLEHADECQLDNRC